MQLHTVRHVNVVTFQCSQEFMVYWKILKQIIAYL